MKLLIAGSRNLPHRSVYEALESALCNPAFEISEIVHGGARGVDRTAGEWAEQNGFPIHVFNAEWARASSPTFDTAKGYDPLAGFRRNEVMAEYADRALIVWDGQSPGTQHMMACMRKLGKPVDVVVLR